MRFTLLLILTLTAAGGCVLNVPSARHPELADHRCAGEGCAVCRALDGGALRGAEAEQPPPAPIPWPRFHPVPTRPVFDPPAARSPLPIPPTEPGPEAEMLPELQSPYWEAPAEADGVERGPVEPPESESD